MGTPAHERESALRVELRAALGGLDPAILTGMASALERNRDRLVGGSWGIDDGDGCLLTLAARELGEPSGEELLRSSISAVRVPALFDEFWALVLARTGDAESARAVTHRLVVEALARDNAQGAGEEATASSPETARSARPR